VLKPGTISTLLVATLILIACGNTQPAPETRTAPTGQQSAFENHLIKVPGTSPEQAKVYLVQHGVKRWVVYAAWLTKRGYRVPEDVQEVSPAEFQSIPTGDAIE
jgi:DMSO/TMAO reductase YedYZ molybdopterin-dependent catalytic subunit